jgi:hypothetical protein
MQDFLRSVWQAGGLLLVSALAGDASAAADCLTSNGKTACGYHCVSGENQVRCSQTPDGVCSVSSGIVACWDPPAVLRGIFGARALGARCVTNYGQMACGYACETSSDRAQCAQTPFGACGASDGRVACWDPPAAVMVTRRERTPTAECLVNSGKVACGYHCIAFDGTVHCAQTTEGGCRVEQGKVICWDPPLESLGAVFDPAAELACMEGVDGRVCGYRCLATSIHSGCGSNRADSCKPEPDKIACAPAN